MSISACSSYGGMTIKMTIATFLVLLDQNIPHNSKIIISGVALFSLGTSPWSTPGTTPRGRAVAYRQAAIRTQPECFRFSYRVLVGMNNPTMRAAFTNRWTWLMLTYKLADMTS